MTKTRIEPEGFSDFWEMKRLAAVYLSASCSVEGCSSKRKVRQYCGAHYAALKRRGEHPKTEPRVRISASHLSLIEAVGFKGSECVVWRHGQTGGYPVAQFKGKRIRVHVSICEEVNGKKPSEAHEVAHECGVSLCCNPSHLSWKTHRENILDKNRHGTMPRGEKHHRAKLTARQVADIRDLKRKVSRLAIAQMFRVGRSTVDNILDGVTWRGVA